MVLGRLKAGKLAEETGRLNRQLLQQEAEKDQVRPRCLVCAVYGASDLQVSRSGGMYTGSKKPFLVLLFGSFTC